MDERTVAAPTSRRAGLRAVLAVAVMAFFLVLTGGSPSEAQACDPIYGCDPDPGGGARPGVGCGLSAQLAAEGSLVTATVSNLPVGTPVQITFNGTPVASGVAGSGQSNEFSAPPLVNGRYGAMQAERVSLELRFRVPELAEGTYQVFAIGPGFSAACATSGFRVLDTRVSNVATPGQGGGRSLARTGIEIAMYLAIALVLVLIGWYVARWAKRRRRRATMERLRHPGDRMSSHR